MNNFTELLKESKELAIEAEVAILVNKKLEELGVASKPVLKASKVNMNGRITTLKNLKPKDFGALTAVIKTCSLNIQYVANDSALMILLDYRWELFSGGSNGGVAKYRYNFSEKKWNSN